MKQQFVLVELNGETEADEVDVRTTLTNSGWWEQVRTADVTWLIGDDDLGLASWLRKDLS